MFGKIKATFSIPPAIQVKLTQNENDTTFDDPTDFNEAVREHEFNQMVNERLVEDEALV